MPSDHHQLGDVRNCISKEIPINLRLFKLPLLIKRNEFIGLGSVDGIHFDKRIDQQSRDSNESTDRQEMLYEFQA